jgi:integrase
VTRPPTEEQQDRIFETPCRRITLTEPTAPDVYWRLDWQEDGRRRQTTGGRTKESAQAAAAKVLARLDAHAAPQSTTRVGDVLERYISRLHGQASPNHGIKVEPDLRAALAPYLKLPCDQLDRRRVRAACDACASESAGSARKSRLSSFLAFGFDEGYFSEPQLHLLKRYKWARPPGTNPRPTREFLPAQHGEADRFVTPDQVPLHGALADVGDALEELLPGRGKLAIELTYTAGYRSGELRAADAQSIDLETKHIDIHWQVLDISAEKLAKFGRSTRRSRPKGNKVRETNFPAVTPTGYHLLDALGERLEKIEWEHKRGMNPRRLLIPAAQGGWMWNTAFTNDYFHKAAETADWEFIRWVEDDGTPRKLLRHTFHTLRHRFARDRIDEAGYTPADLQEIGGWDSAQVVWERYYGRSKDAIKVCDEKLAAWELRMAQARAQGAAATR